MFKLYLIVDQINCSPHNIENVVEMAIKGGVSGVQLREKNVSTREILRLGKKLQILLRKYNIPLIINDRVDIALALNADGVHLGQSDMPYELARNLLGDDKIIGITVANKEQAIEAERWNVDYLGVGPVFPTQTKLDTAPPLGLEELKQICDFSRHHICAIGGINATNVHAVLAAGANGLAVVSSICGANNPQLASQKLFNIINKKS